MNQRNNGLEVERLIIKKYPLEDDTKGFDATYLNVPVEIKSCLLYHSNGLTPAGSQRRARGRFWIDNDNHRLLLNENGLYIFVLYKVVNDHIVIIDEVLLKASYINKYVNSEGNTKINWKYLFPYIYKWDKSCLY